MRNVVSLLFIMTAVNPNVPFDWNATNTPVFDKKVGSKFSTVASSVRLITTGIEGNGVLNTTGTFRIEFADIINGDMYPDRKFDGPVGH